MRRKTLLNRNVIIVLMLFIFLMTAFISTAYSFWYFPDESSKTVKTDMKVDDIEENFKNKDTYGSYLKIIDCRDGVIPTDADFAKSESGFLDNSKNFSDNGNIFIGKNGNYSKKVFGVSSSNVNVSYKFPLNPTLLNPNPEGEYVLGSFVSSVFYRSGTSITSSDTSATGSDTSITSSGTSATGSDTSMTEIYLYDLLNSQYKLVDHLTNESIELGDGNGTSSDESYSSTKFEDYRKNIGCSFSKSRILFLVPRDTKLTKKETPNVPSDYNIYFHNEAITDKHEHNPSNGKYDYSDLDSVWLWNDRTDFGVSLPLHTDSTDDSTGTSDKSLHINYRTLYKAWNCDNSFKDTNEAGFIMTPQTAPTGIIFKKNDGTKLVPKDKHLNTEYLALPLPPINSTSNSTPLHFNIHIDAALNGKFTISTDQDVDLNQDVDLDKKVDLTQNKNAKNKNIVYYSTSSTSPNNVLDHLWMWSKSEEEAGREVGRWISSNYVYKFKMTGFDKAVSCFSYNYGEKFNFYNKWKGPVAGPEHFTPGFTFNKKKAGEKKDYNYDSLVLVDYNNSDNGKTEDIDISGLFNGTSECTSIYLLENNKKVRKFSSKAAFITALNDLK